MKPVFESSTNDQALKLFEDRVVLERYEYGALIDEKEMFYKDVKMIHTDNGITIYKKDFSMMSYNGSLESDAVKYLKDQVKNASSVEESKNESIQSNKLTDEEQSEIDALMNETLENEKSESALLFETKGMGETLRLYEDRISVTKNWFGLKETEKTVDLTNIRSLSSVKGVSLWSKDNVLMMSICSFSDEAIAYIQHVTGLDITTDDDVKQAKIEAADAPIRCPKCGSSQVSANRKGITYFTGAIGAKKVIVTCLNCGKQWKAGKH